MPYIRLITCYALFISHLLVAQAQVTRPLLNGPDSDSDGVSDELEQYLLSQFIPNFLVSHQDCSSLPSQFAIGRDTPNAEAENGTIYTQAFPVKIEGYPQAVELHFYHLWKQDCGSRSHPLDAEHVSALVAESRVNQMPQWKALYWYAAAHEDTVCDVSQIARAFALRAENHGPTVWVSNGKHASFLSPHSCQNGCGGDRCDVMQAFSIKQLINLGEVGKPMNGTFWTSSPKWPLATKMTRSDFPATALAQIDILPATEIALFNPGPHPAQGVIAVGYSTAEAFALGSENTISSISVAGDSTNDAVESSYKKFLDTIGKSAHRVKTTLERKSKR